jgi:hypothetical protein
MKVAMEYMAKGAIRMCCRIGVCVRNLQGYSEGKENREKPTEQITPDAMSHPRFKPMAVHTAIVAPEPGGNLKKSMQNAGWPYFFGK